MIVLPLSSLVGASNTNEPPKIVRLDPATLGEPDTYSIAAKVYIGVNTLTCVASNADEVYWMYKANPEDVFTRTLPNYMEQKAQQESGSTVNRVLTDENHTIKPDRAKINGYYQCFAANKYGYTTPSPVLRLLFAGKLQ